MFGSEFGQARDAFDQSVPNKRESLPVKDQIRVVPDERTRGAKMDDAAGRGRHLSKEVYVGHHIMAKPLLVLRYFLEVDLVESAPHFVECLLRNRQPQLVLCGGESQPQTPPRSIAIRR